MYHRLSIAFLAAVLGATGLVTGSVHAAVAAPGSGSPRQVAVIPPDAPAAVVGDQVVVAGATGFLHRFAFSSSYLWTSYSSGRTVPVPALSHMATVRSAGGDLVEVFSSPTTVTELDLADMTTRQWPLPAGDRAPVAFGDEALVSTFPGGVLTWAVLNLDTQVTTPISGLPTGARLLDAVGDTSAVALSYGDSTGGHFGLLDLATAVLIPITDPDKDSQQAVLSSDSVALYDPASQVVRVYSRAGLTSGSETAGTSVTLPPAASGYFVALAGDHVLAVSAKPSCEYCNNVTAPALDVPVAAGMQAGKALAQAQTGFGSIAQAPGGAALAVGGSGPRDWSVRRFTVDGGDHLVDTPLLPLTGPLTNGGLSLAQGMLRHIEIEPVPGGSPNYLLFNHILVASPGRDWSDPPVNGGSLASPLPCATKATCARTVDGNWYGTSYLSAGVPGRSIILRQQMAAGDSSTSTSLPSASGTLVDASSDYAIVDGVRPVTQYLVYPGYEKAFAARRVTGAALWFDTLWSSDGPGHLRPNYLSLDSLGTAGKPIATGTACTATEIQATERWIYWSCGKGRPAGVYDLAKHVDISVPAGPMLLGDGYLVQHDAATGNLNLYIIHTDKVQGPVVLANVPAGPTADDRGITWAVDKYSGDVAYVAADDSVHVIATGVPATKPAATNASTFNSDGGGILGFCSKCLQWYQFVAMSRPITGWSMTVRRLSTGQRVFTEAGGPTRSSLSVHWDGYLPDRKKAFSGRYFWSMRVRTADGAPPVTFNGGIVTAYCGQLPFRSYDCSGVPALLADRGGASGESIWFNGTNSGALRSIYPPGSFTENWPLCSEAFCAAEIVPFGDFNGDGYGDILVLYRSGVLRAYLGFGQAYFGGVKSIKIGSGWSTYNALAYPGDLTGNGKPDLVARDHRGRLWLYASTGRGTFRRRTKIGSGWGGYVRLVGAGDLTNVGANGPGDLLAIDRNGVMWRFDGNGHGGLRPRRYVSSGWSRYNAVIGIGDLNNDGCNDLVARDRRGKLWFFAGNCRGVFARPRPLSKGWQQYQMLF